MIRTALLAAALVAASPALAQTAVQSPPPSATAPTPAAAPAQLDPKALALANEIIDIGYPPEERSARFKARMAALIAQVSASMTTVSEGENPKVAAAARLTITQLVGRLTERMNAHLPDIYGAMARAYARQFSYDELIQIRAFVSTPAGKRFFSVSSSLTSDPDVAAANKRATEDVLDLLPAEQKRLMDEIKAQAAKSVESTPKSKSKPE